MGRGSQACRRGYLAGRSDVLEYGDGRVDGLERVRRGEYWARWGVGDQSSALSAARARRHGARGQGRLAAEVRLRSRTLCEVSGTPTRDGTWSDGRSLRGHGREGRAALLGAARAARRTLP